MTLTEFSSRSTASGARSTLSTKRLGNSVLAYAVENSPKGCFYLSTMYGRLGSIQNPVAVIPLWEGVLIPLNPPLEKGDSVCVPLFLKRGQGRLSKQVGETMPKENQTTNF